MPSSWVTTRALRLAALLLLVMSMFLGPAGLSGSPVFVSAYSACGVSCPCEDADLDHEEGASQGAHSASGDETKAADTDAGEGDPCDDNCPDNCPNCHCSPGIAMAVLQLPVTSVTSTCTAVRVLAPGDAPASGMRSSLFRPPRSLG